MKLELTDRPNGSSHCVSHQSLRCHPPRLQNTLRPGSPKQTIKKEIHYQILQLRKSMIRFDAVPVCMRMSELDVGVRCQGAWRKINSLLQPFHAAASLGCGVHWEMRQCKRRNGCSRDWRLEAFSEAVPAKTTRWRWMITNGPCCASVLPLPIAPTLPTHWDVITWAVCSDCCNTHLDLHPRLTSSRL